jgi:hypothetical protein
MIDPPYPKDIEAKGWCLDLDYERIDQSDTWALANCEQRPWLLMLWLVSWRQSPVASLPNNHKLIAARLGMPEDQFTRWSDVLLSGWELATDGRLYHKTLTEQVLKMTEKRVKDRSRVAAYRARTCRSNDLVASCNALQGSDSHVSSAPPTSHHPPTPTPIKDKRESPRERVDLFEDFWKQYPKKVGKDAAKKAFEKRKPDKALLKTMLESLEVQKKLTSWTTEDMKYVPNPATWLNQGRWMDELENKQPDDWRKNPFFAGAI